MAKCTYTLRNGDGEEQKGLTITQLNEELLKLINEGESAIMYYSLNSKERTLNIIEDIKLEFKGAKTVIEDTGANEDNSVSYDIDKSCSVSKILESRKLPDGYELTAGQTLDSLIEQSQYLVTPFSLSDWRKTEKVLMRKKHPHWTDTQIEEFLNRVINTWDTLIQYGNEVHEVLENHIKGKKSLPNLKYISDAIAKDIILEYDKFIRHMESVYNTKFEVFSELPIKTDKINPIYKNLKNPVETINGRVDLLLIDKDGNAHIVDFKISRRKPGAWGTMENLLIQDVAQDGGHDSTYADQNYPESKEVETENGKAFVLTEDNINDRTYSSPKKVKIGYQLEMYKRILEANGIPVRSTRILPFKLDLSYDKDSTLPNTEAIDESRPTGIKGVSLEVDYGKLGGKDVHDTINPHVADKKAIRKIFEQKALFSNQVTFASQVEDRMKKFFPTYTMAAQVHGRNVTMEDLQSKVKHVLSSEEKYKTGKRFKFWDPNKKENNARNGGYVYTATKEEMNEYLEGYLNTFNANVNAELKDLSSRLSTIMNSSTRTEGELLDPNDKNKQGFLNLHFGKYIKPNSGWNYAPNENLLEYGIFVFTKDGVVDIVSFVNRDLMELVGLSEGTNILGETHRNDQVDDKKTFNSTIGNIELMKLLMIVDVCGDLSSYKINTVKVLNLWNRTGREDLNESVLDNYVQLCLAHNEKTKLNSKSFTSTYQWAINEVEDVLDQSALSGITSTGTWRTGYDINTAIGKLSFLNSAQQSIINKYEVQTYSDINTPIGHAYQIITAAINQLKHRRTYVEHDQGEYLNKQGGQVYTGTMINSAGFSPSLNMQVVAAITNDADQRIKHEATPKLIVLGNKISNFMEESGRSQLLGNEATLYKNLLRTTSEGNIDPSFRFKKESDPSLSESERKVLKEFLKQILTYKYKGSQEAFDNDGDDAYNVPIKLASTGSRLQNSGLKGMATHLKTKWENILNPQDNLTSSQANTVALQQLFEGYIYNRYDLNTQSRNTLLSELSLDDLEMDLGAVMMDYVNTYTINQVYNSILPQLHGVVMGLRYQQKYLGMDYTSTEDVIMKFIRANVLNQKVMDKNMQAVYKPIAVLKKLFTTTALGLNYVSGLREFLQGTWVNISRTMAQAYGKEQFTMADLSWAWTLIIKEAPLDTNKVTLLDAINSEYGMANMDPDMLAQKLGSSNRGLWNFHSGKLFVFNQIPDFYHRMGILLAKMKHEGLWECHTLDENGLLQYDYTKDQRFALLHDSTSDKNSVKYKEQMALYTAMKEQFEAEGFDFSDKPKFFLPRAYTYQEATSIKSFSELCFGHYDKNTQMMAKHTFVGALFLHFRTYISAKLEQWVLKPGNYDQGSYEFKADQNGDRFVLITVEEDGETYSYVEKFSNVKEGDNWQFISEWQGRFLEGIAYTMWDIGRALLTLDAKKLKTIWQIPTKRANIKLFINDMVIVALLGAIFNAILMSEEEVANRSAFTNTIMSAVYTSTKDGVIFNTVGPLVTDWTPPLISQIKRTYYNATDLLGGDSTVGEFIRSGIGISRTYNSYVNQA